MLQTPREAYDTLQTLGADCGIHYGSVVVETQEGNYTYFPKKGLWKDPQGKFSRTQSLHYFAERMLGL